MKIPRSLKPTVPVYASFFNVDNDAGESQIWFGFIEMAGIILDFWVCQSEYQALHKQEDRILREMYGERALAAIQWYLDHNIYPCPHRSIADDNRPMGGSSKQS